MASVELLRAKTPSETAEPMLQAMKAAMLACGDTVKETEEYHGGRDWLVLFGVGYEQHHIARTKQVASGKRALLIDLGYWGRKKVTGYLRMSIDHDHPQRLLDRTKPDPSRWDALHIGLRHDADPAGPIILVGMGRKSRVYLKNGDQWEKEALARIQAKHPGRRVIYRQKSPDDETRLRCERDADTPIDRLLRGASLVVARHSNVCVDAVVAGVPYEATDGAAMWLVGKEYSAANRLDFLRRLAWWQWKTTEAAQAWRFAKEMVP